jgi:hypothetical protein
MTDSKCHGWWARRVGTRPRRRRRSCIFDASILIPGGRVAMLLTVPLGPSTPAEMNSWRFIMLQYILFTKRYVY